MSGNIQRKIVVVMLTVLMTPMYIHSMLVTQRQAQYGGAASTVVSLLVLSQFPGAHKHVAGVISTGIFLGGMTYLGAREYSSEQMIKRADDTIQEMKQTKLRNLVFVENDDNSRSVEKITGAYAGLNFFDNATKDVNKYKALLLNHLGTLERAKLNNTKTYADLDIYILC